MILLLSVLVLNVSSEVLSFTSFPDSLALSPGLLALPSAKSTASEGLWAAVRQRKNNTEQILTALVMLREEWQILPPKREDWPAFLAKVGEAVT